MQSSPYVYEARYFWHFRLCNLAGGRSFKHRVQNTAALPAVSRRILSREPTLKLYLSAHDTTMPPEKRWGSRRPQERVFGQEGWSHEAGMLRQSLNGAFNFGGSRHAALSPACEAD
jgi:hypothetical protein